MQPTDHDDVIALARRLTTGVAPWRDHTAVAQTTTDWVADAVAGHDLAVAPVFVAVAHDRVLGFAAGGTRKHWAGGVDAYIGELVTDAAAEGQGIGRALVRALESWAVDRGFDRITLETGAANDRAIDFYERLGYRHEEVVLTREVPR